MKKLLNAARATWWVLSPENGPLGLVLLSLFVMVPIFGLYDGKVSIKDIPTMWLGATQALTLWFGIELLTLLFILGVIWLIGNLRRQS